VAVVMQFIEPRTGGREHNGWWEQFRWMHGDCITGEPEGPVGGEESPQLIARLEEDPFHGAKT